jgi:ATP adenylyltransferase
MNESLILSEFDKLQQSGLALYDENQKIINHVEGGLKVRILTDF